MGAPAWLDVNQKFMVRGLLVPRNSHEGKLLALCPTVNVTGPQWLLRTSDGCTFMMLPFKNSRGVPSQSPMRQMVETVLGSPEMVCVWNVVAFRR